MSATVTIRFRLNVRLPDKEGKYRDELTQEGEISLTDAFDYGVVKSASDLTQLIEGSKVKAEELRANFYKEAKRLGACDYTEEKKQ